MICCKDKEKVYNVIRTEKIDAVQLSFLNLMDDIIHTIKKQGLLKPFPWHDKNSWS